MVITPLSAYDATRLIWPGFSSSYYGRSYLKGVRLTITDGQVRIEAVRDGATAAHRVIPALLTGDEMTVWFNAGYLAQMASVHKGSIRLSLISPLKPALITPAAGIGYRAILVPLREPEEATPKPDPKVRARGRRDREGRSMSENAEVLVPGRGLVHLSERDVT